MKTDHRKERVPQIEFQPVRVAGEWRAFFCKTCTHGQKEDGVVVLKEGEELVVMVRLAPETVHVEARVQVMVLRVCNRSGCSTGVLSGSPQRFVAMSLLVRFCC